MALLHIEWLEVESGSPQVSIAVLQLISSVNSAACSTTMRTASSRLAPLEGGPARDGSAKDLIHNELTKDHLVGGAEGDAEAGR